MTCLHLPGSRLTTSPEGMRSHAVVIHTTLFAAEQCCFSAVKSSWRCFQISAQTRRLLLVQIWLLSAAGASPRERELALEPKAGCLPTVRLQTQEHSPENHTLRSDMGPDTTIRDNLLLAGTSLMCQCSDPMFRLEVANPGPCPRRTGCPLSAWTV